MQDSLKYELFEPTKELLKVINKSYGLKDLMDLILTLRDSSTVSSETLISNFFRKVD
jgi:hypothetical protein